MKQQAPLQRGEALLSRRLFPSLLIALLIALSLVVVYYGSSFAPGLRLSDDPSASFQPLSHSSFESSDSSPNPHFLRSFPVCDQRFSELIPCMDRNLIYQLKLKLNLSVMEHYERHCPPRSRHYNCMIPPPPGYRVPIRWPLSRDEVWKVNIPHTHLAFEKSDQHWMVVRGEKINFPGGGTHFHTGADKYITHIAQMLKFPNGNLSNGGNIRTALDVGCGVASFGAYLLPMDIIAMSLAPNDVHENQIQFALERGIPSTLGVLGTKRLPYPSRSFELAHCSRCRIDWLQRDGILLLELDRVLRPGGYFVYSSPEAYVQDEKNQRIWNTMSDLVRRMCWRIASKKNQTVIWVKPLSNGCYFRRDPGLQPPLCSADDDPDAVWNVPMKTCISPYSKRVNRAKGSGLVPWPQRLTAPPPRLEELGITSEKYHEDNEIWHWRVLQYWKHLSSEIEKDSFRNVMDIRANLGGFAAALADKDVWVMNVVPVNESSKLKIIYDRGLIGTVHDCILECMETFSKGVHRALVPVESQTDGAIAVELVEASPGYRMLTQMDVLSFLRVNGNELKDIMACSVGELEAVTENVFAITKDTKVIDAIRSMRSCSLAAVPVVASEASQEAHTLQDGRGRKLLDTFSATDIRGCSIVQLESMLNVSVWEFKKCILAAPIGTAGTLDEQRKLITCHYDTSLAEAIEEAVVAHVHRLWVVDEEELIRGVVSLSDMLRAIRSKALMAEDELQEVAIAESTL